MKLRKIYSRVKIHKPIESIFNTFVIYSNLKLQIDNPLKVLLELFSNFVFFDVFVLLIFVLKTTNQMHRARTKTCFAVSKTGKQSGSLPF
jgi:hypothetical protein